MTRELKYSPKQLSHARPEPVVWKPPGPGAPFTVAILPLLTEIWLGLGLLLSSKNSQKTFFIITTFYCLKRASCQKTRENERSEERRSLTMWGCRPASVYSLLQLPSVFSGGKNKQKKKNPTTLSTKNNQEHMKTQAF